MKIIFAGTPEFAERHLSALLSSPTLDVCAVYTQPDRPAGRGKKLSASPVKRLALEHGLAVEQPLSLKTPDSQDRLREYGADLMVVVAYGLLLPKAVLDIPRFGCINVHGSILPRWRGAAPIQRAIEAGDAESGVTIMQMDEGLDTGNMLLKESCLIGAEDTAADLHDTLAKIGPPALLAAISGIAADTLIGEVQDDSLSTYARKIDKHEARIDWSLNARDIERKVRALYPFPICYSELGGLRIKVHRVRLSVISRDLRAGQLHVEQQRLYVGCGEGCLEILQLQLPGKNAVAASDYLNGIGQRLPHTSFDNL